MTVKINLNKACLPFFAMSTLLFSCGGNDKTSKDDTEKVPNIIVILTDDQGWGDVSFNGNTNLKTPNIDKIGRNGAIFDHFYVCPVCAPTRAEFLTGRYNPRIGVSGVTAGEERLNADETTIAEIFKRAGYSTAAFGKWHNGMQFPYHPNARGFDEFYGFCSGHWANYYNPVMEHNGELVKGNGYIINDFTEKAIDFIEKNETQPFFVYLAYNTPHTPMQVPDEWWNKFKDKDIGMRNREPETEIIQATRAVLAMCENIDWNVGRVLGKIIEMGLEENTIILYFSDNGPNTIRWNGGMKGRKGSTDEGGVRSPFVIQWKGVIDSGKRIPQIAGAIDLLPTLTDLAGIPCITEKPLDGISLKSLLTGNNTNWTERLIFNFWRGNTSVRSQHYRLDKDNMLFDMVSDPGQYTDISHIKPDISEKLIEAKNKWMTEAIADLPKEDKRPFPIGHPGSRNTQIPARDGFPYGNILRSARAPNSSYFTNWTSQEDFISWDIEVLTSGEYEVILYYTCPLKDVGSEVELSFGSNKLTGKVSEAHDPPLVGMEYDLVKRGESYDKDFKSLPMGNIQLEKGRGKLKLRALSIPGSQVMDFKLIMFKRNEI